MKLIIFWVLVSFLLGPFLLFSFLLASTELSAPTLSEWAMFLLSLRGIAGFSALGIAGAVVQLAIYLMRSNFAPMDGKKKLVVVQGLSVAAGVVALRSQNFDWVSSFLHANTLGAIQVFGHQIWKQFNDPGDRYEIPKK